MSYLAVANLDRINQLAETSAGFIWRFTGDTEAEQRVFGDNIIVNLSTWADVQSLHRFVYRSDHTAIMKKRAEWFVPMEVSHVLWWHRLAEPPSIEEAKNRLKLLVEHGAHSDVLTFGTRGIVLRELSEMTRKHKTELLNTCRNA